jgi:cobalt-precorrin 5A hydrolase
MGGHQTMSDMIVAGIGCRANCPAEAIVAVVQRACQEAGRAANALAAPAFKAAEAGLHEAARVLALPLILVEAAALLAVQERYVTHSAAALRAVGIASVAEGSALASAGSGSRLILPRIADACATCALAEAAT